MKWIVTPGGIALYLTECFIACSLLQLLAVQKVEKRNNPACYLLIRSAACNSFV